LLSSQSPCTTFFFAFTLISFVRFGTVHRKVPQVQLREEVRGVVLEAVLEGLEVIEALPVECPLGVLPGGLPGTRLPMSRLPR
jgi:hypothetical protein